ncbi:2a700c72-d27a-4c2f-9025-1c212f645761 [Sclerotinia trifoliorum]|uniref:2a700c72-d27a-4c2f-9025-1c212f645761 n=1 Tax=Sclerotinia trifoliorum TaxID=28548 RepID=A0A8H2VLJ8_9HELO|nr:2a700c72-d27a-4c2f-9025-1c212f645761 [Sclerotinia trifoliorum]
MVPPPLPRGPIYLPTFSIWKRIYLSIRLRVFIFITNISIAIRTHPYNCGRANLPTFTKTYPKHPSLTHRIWIPSTYKSGDAPPPLYLDIHGGAYIVGRPALDDAFCSYFSSKHNVLVISLDYSKAPKSPYPRAINELTDLINIILEDESLPFDRAKVALGGFSAGGTFSLAVPQAASLQGKIKGVCSIYPLCDFVTPRSVGIAARPAYAPKDRLADLDNLYDYGYIPRGTDLCEPRLSVAYAKREVLPKKLFIVGCELDMLCYDAELFAEKLVGRDRVEGELDWEMDGVRWKKFMGAEHGFDNELAFKQKDKVKKEQDTALGKKMYDDMAEWLFREVYH